MVDSDKRAAADQEAPFRIWVAAAALLAGAALIWAGGAVEGLSAYDQSIFAHIGTAVALVGPLYVVERLLSRRIGLVRKQVDEVQSSTDAAVKDAAMALTRVDDLAVRVQQRLDEMRAADRSLRERAASGENQGDFVALYDKAATGRSIDRLGFRTPVAGLVDMWLRVRVVHRAPEGASIALVELTFENDHVEPIGNTAVWSPNEPAEDVFVRLATSLQKGGKWPGDSAFDPIAILASIAEALGRIIDLRTGPGGNRDVRQIASLVNDSWAVTREGLDSTLAPNVWAEHHELIGDRSYIAFQRLEGQVKQRGWDDGQFREAFGEAEQVHSAFARASPGTSPFSRG